jgi:hypothetical protein
MIVEYMLEQVGRGDAKRAPSFIRDGGHWFNPSNFTYLGWVPNLAEREFYVPDSLSVMTRQDVIDRGLSLHASFPMVNYGEVANIEEEPTTLTDAEVTTLLGDWYDTMTNNYTQQPAEAYVSYDSGTITARVVFARKGLIITGTPQLDVSVGGITSTLDYQTSNFNSITFTKTQAASSGTEISLDANTSITLNGGTITDGTDNVILSLTSLSESELSITVE